MKMAEFLKDQAKKLKRELLALYYAYRDAHTPLACKAIIMLTLGYALSPIDLIPDFIPVLGYLDDLVIVPALIALSLRLIPADILAAARRRAEEEPVRLGRNWLFAFLFVAIWAGIAAWLWKLVCRTG